MDLLNVLRAEALDPAYVEAVRRHGGARVRVGWILPALIVVGALFGLAFASTVRTAPAAALERAELVQRIHDAEGRLDTLRDEGARLGDEVTTLQRNAGALSPDERERADLLAGVSGVRAVAGPGVRLTLDDGADASVRGSRVVDADLRMAANGLWAAGAEAVSINGHRLTVRTAIRNAGDAITVDYRSLTRPYVIEAIGDGRALSDGFPQTDGGVWLTGLRDHFGVSWGMARVGELSLPADPGLTVHRASAAR